MFNIRHALVFLAGAVLLLSAASSQAQDESPRTKRRLFGFRSLSDTVEHERKGVFVLPLIYYTPDTRWAFGAAGVYYFKIPSDDGSKEETRVSNVQFLMDYTQNRQLDVWGQWNVFTRHENYLFKGEIRYRNFPDRFYGIGNRSDKKNEERYEYNLFSVKSLMLKKIVRSVFVGVDYHYEKEYNFKYTPGGVLEEGSITGYNGGVQSAIGLVGIFDCRDNVINTFKGSLFEISSYYYLPGLGSTFRFTYLNLLYQKFWPLRRRHILALQSKIRFGTGEVPFLDLSAAGNDDILRGYPKNRFRDVNFAGAQVEYRFPVYWRFGMVVFAGAGDVFKKASDVTFPYIKYSYGAGLRFAVNPAERLNIRLDYGRGQEGGYFYFVVAEAF